MPSSLLASSVSSLRSASLLGAGAVSDSFNNKNFLASSGGIFSPSNRRASSANCVTTAVSFSFAWADIVSVSSVIKFSCTQLALLARTAEILKLLFRFLHERLRFSDGRRPFAMRRRCFP